MAIHWYLLQTKPRKELMVVNHLHAADIETFFPTIMVHRGYGRGMREDALFPLYVFVKADLMSPKTPDLRHLAGVRSLVRFGDTPAIVPQWVIEHLQIRVRARNERTTLADDLYERGEFVHIQSGPLAGLEAVFQKGLKGTERAEVFVNILGKLSKVQLDVVTLAPKL